MTIPALMRKHKQLIAYIFWGGATTAVNYGVYFLCTRLRQIHYISANVLAWLTAVLFAFWANKCFVFASKSWKASVVLPEFAKFTSARVLSGFLETGILWLCVDLLHMHDGVIKLLANIVVIILNYIFSKLFIFRRRTENG